MVEHRVTACLPCQAATDNHTRDPLHPNIAPEQPWSTVYTDHWGPTPDKRHILVLIDALTKYPEVISVTGTSAEENIHGFAEAFARHGVPHKLRSDKGPPFNGIDTHLLQRWFKNIALVSITAPISVLRTRAHQTPLNFEEIICSCSLSPKM